MSEDKDRDLSRREFVQGTVSGLALGLAPATVLAAASGKDADKTAVLAQIPKMHAENLKRLQEWIALPSIAAENRNFPQGPEYMAKLAQDAGFTGVKLIPTSGAGVAADDQYRRTRGGLHGTGREDGAAAQGRGQDRHAIGAGYDRGRHSRQAEGASGDARVRRY